MSVGREIAAMASNGLVHILVVSAFFFSGNTWQMMAAAAIIFIDVARLIAFVLSVRREVLMMLNSDSINVTSGPPVLREAPNDETPNDYSAKLEKTEIMALNTLEFVKREKERISQQKQAKDAADELQKLNDEN